MKDNPCKFYIRHACNRGISCRFSHKPEEQFCWNYLKNKKCKLKNCLQRHEKRICKFWKSGFCRFSAKHCWFFHSNQDRFSTESQPQSYQNKLKKEAKSKSTNSFKERSSRIKQNGIKKSLRKQNVYLRKELQALKTEIKSLTILINTLRENSNTANENCKELNSGESSQKSQEMLEEKLKIPAQVIVKETNNDKCFVDKNFSNNIKNYFKTQQRQQLQQQHLLLLQHQQYQQQKQ